MEETQARGQRKRAGRVDQKAYQSLLLKNGITQKSELS